MNFVFRCDASLQIGTGHVMRCLTLANALKKKGHECTFICKAHAGHLIEKIKQSGFQAYVIGNNHIIDKSLLNEDNTLFHANWLGATQQQDAQDCLAILGQLQVDWLIVDHYALDKTWQQILRPYYKKLMIIDDLGDREHLADLLLDQNYGSTFEKYKSLVPESCTVLMGTKFALLRPEFAMWRDFSLKRRKNEIQVKNILITLGGVDPDNYTSKILEQLAKTKLSSQVVITVVMGATAPHLQAVQQQAAIMPMPVKTTVEVNVSNMAELMSNADLAIGAAGATTWERCCLGLPTIQLITAENQRQIAEDLAADYVIKLIENISEITQLITTIEHWLLPIVIRAQSITDGLGAERVVSNILEGVSYDSRYS